MSVGLPPGLEVHLEGHERVSILQTRVEDVKVGPPHPLQVVLQHHLHTTEEEETALPAIWLKPAHLK